jgi:hypothetical protein
MAADSRMPVDGEPDPKPYKVHRVDSNGNFVSKDAEYATEAEARAHKRRLDWHYAIYHGTQKI